MVFLIWRALPLHVRLRDMLYEFMCAWGVCFKGLWLGSTTLECHVVLCYFSVGACTYEPAC